MSKRTVKFSAPVMALFILFMLLTGCGSQNGEKESTGASDRQTELSSGNTQQTAPLKNVTLKVIFPGDEPIAQKEVSDAISEAGKDELNVSFEYAYVPWDQYWSKLNLLISAGEAFDLFWNHTSNMAPFIAKGQLMELNALIDNDGADLKKVVPDYFWDTAGVNGKILGVPSVGPVADTSKVLLIRKDLREKYGLPVIKTIAELETYFEAIQKNEPGMMIHLSAGSPFFMYRELGNPQLIMTGGQSSQTSIMYVDINDGEMKVQSFYESEIFKKMCEYGSKWREKGWIPSNLQEIKDYQAPFKEGKAADCWGSTGGGALFTSQMQSTVPGSVTEEIFLNPDQPKYITGAAGNMLSIPATSKNSERAMRFINWIFKAQENYDLMSYGIKDEHYVLKGERFALPEGVTPDKNPYNAINWAWENIKLKRFDVSYSDNDIDYLINWDNGAVRASLFGFTFNGEAVKSELAQINAIEGEFFSLMYTGVIDYETHIGKYMERLRRAGLDKVIAECQNQIDAFKAGKQ